MICYDVIELPDRRSEESCAGQIVIIIVAPCK